MNLATSKTIRSNKFHPMLITSTVIKQVEQLATKQGILNFKITTRDGNIVYDSAKIVGANDDEEASTTKKTKMNQ